MMWYHEALLQYSAADYTGLTWMNWKNILIKKSVFFIRISKDIEKLMFFSQGNILFYSLFQTIYSELLLF